MMIGVYTQVPCNFHGLFNDFPGRKIGILDQGIELVIEKHEAKRVLERLAVGVRLEVLFLIKRLHPFDGCLRVADVAEVTLDDPVLAAMAANALDAIGE